MRPIKNGNKKIIILCSILGVIIVVFCICLGVYHANNENKSPLLNVDSVELDENGIPNKTIKTKIWDKEFIQLKTQDVSIDNHWSEYIKIGDDRVSSNEFIDISELHNYFIDEQDDTFAAEKCYVTNSSECQLPSHSTQDVQFAISKLTVTTMLHNQQNAYIKSIEFQASINYNEGGLENIKKQAQSGEKFGLGNLYKDIKKNLSNEVQLFEDEQDGLLITFYSYTSEHVKLELRFARLLNDDIDDAVLIGVKWTPITIVNK